MDIPEKIIATVIMTKDELFRHLIDFDVQLDDPIVTVPQALVAQEVEDIRSGKSDYISFDVIKLIQDTIVQISINTDDNRSELNTQRIAILAELQETISEWELQERPALKKQNSTSLDLNEQFNL